MVCCCHGISICLSPLIFMALRPSTAGAQHLSLTLAQFLSPGDQGKRLKVQGKMVACETCPGLSLEESLGKAHGKWLKTARISWSPIIYLWESLRSCGVFTFKSRRRGICSRGNHEDMYCGLTCSRAMAMAPLMACARRTNVDRAISMIITCGLRRS